MYKLYYQPLCPFSRKVRILLAAKELDVELIREKFWERRKEFIALNTRGTVPVLVEEWEEQPNSLQVVCGSSVIAEYLEEKHENLRRFIGNSLAHRAEVRRLQNWFDEKFFTEITKHIINERYFNRFLAVPTPPDSRVITVAKQNLNVHLRYMEFLLENRKYLAGNEITIADFAAAGHVSVLDYFGDINWRNYGLLKDWYSLVKSQKSMSQVLKDRVANLTPPDWYSKLDF